MRQGRGNGERTYSDITGKRRNLGRKLEPTG